MCALHHLVGQRVQGADLTQAAGVQRGMRLRAQTLGQCLRRRQAEQGNIGGLVGLGILAGRLAQRLRVAGHVQDVIDHLERQAHGGAEIMQRRLGRSGQGAWGMRLAGLALLLTSAWGLWMGLMHDQAPWCVVPAA